jgi:hypothetical protein
MDDDILANMRSRVERCRRLASTCSDAKVANTLRLMADEGEADIVRVMAEREANKGDASA